MDLSKVLNIISDLSQKSQAKVFSVCNFNSGKPVLEVYRDILDVAIAHCRSTGQREVLKVYQEIPTSEESILETFGALSEKVKPLGFTDEQVLFIQKRVYRNLNGEFRIIPNQLNSSLDNLGIDGLACDTDILSSKLKNTRRTDSGGLETFDGLKDLQKQHYEAPYFGLYSVMEANLKRINIISSFDKSDPIGFFEKDKSMYRNVCHPMTQVDANKVSQNGLNRAMLLMYLVSGGTKECWRSLYALIHFMVKVPNSGVGHIIYLNDFDAGGNGKSKFVQILQHIFGKSFTAFEPHQLRFNIGLMGKRLVHISEYEDNETSRQLQGMIKSMTGRDKFQYEGKGLEPIVADTYQNFIISSNRYIYFNDAGIKRRLQNFHCSNLLHLLINKYFKSAKFLNNFFGSPMIGTSFTVLEEMSHSLLNYILNDNNEYEIEIKNQDFVLGNLKNPILRYLFSSRCNLNSFIMDSEKGCTLCLFRIDDNAKPEQYNYAAYEMVSWFPDLKLEVSRDALSLTSVVPADVAVRVITAKIKEMDETSRRLKAKDKVFLENATLNEFVAQNLVSQFLGEELKAKSVNMETINNGILYK